MKLLRNLTVAAVCLVASLVSVVAHAADYPTLYAIGSFQDWKPAEGTALTADDNGVYTLNINGANDGDHFKLSTTQGSINNDWDGFDEGVLGYGGSMTKSRLVSLIAGNATDNALPEAGDWVITIYYNEMMMVATHPGDEIPVPGQGGDQGSGDDDQAQYPDLYLCGDFTGWNVEDRYILTRSDNTYTYSTESLNGQFKIRIKESWDKNYGANADNTVTINDAATIEVMNGGANILADNLRDVTIKFVLNTDNDGNFQPTYMQISANGHEAPDTPDNTTDTRLSGTLPVLYINVYTDAEHTALNNEIIDYNLNHKEYFTNAEYWLDMNGCEWMDGAESIGSKDAPLPLQIKARGNWTRTGFSKKPFKLKLDKKQSLLGLSKNKHFAILAHADDTYGYLRNFIGFELGKRIGLPWTPSQQPVEVVINGDYRGLYFLTESIRVDEDRVNIVELDDNVDDPNLVSGGYIVELDNYDEDLSSQIQMEEKSCVNNQILDVLRVTFDTPEVYSDLQRRFITEQFAAMNDYVGANNDNLWKYMDLDDAARYYIVEEIMSHTESYHGSTYLFRDHGAGQKWHFSPLWDFGNGFSGPNNDYFYNHDDYGNTWIPSMRQNITFNNKVKETWLWFMQNKFNGIEDDINTYIDHIATAAKYDRKRWADAPVPDNGSAVVDNSDIQARKNDALSHLNGKVEWLRNNNQFGDYTNGYYLEPERDLTEAAELPDYITTGVEDITVIPAGTAARYYNLQGIEVTNPTPGNIYIVRRGDKTSKAVIL